MNISREIAKIMAEKYDNQTIVDTEIVLIKNDGNDGGHCEGRQFIKDVLYKIVFPLPLYSLDHYMVVCISIHKDGAFVKGLTTEEQNRLLTVYDEYSVDFCFFKFAENVECSFFTNL